MKSVYHWKILVLLLSLTQLVFANDEPYNEVAVKRAYIPSVAIINDPQQLQYYASAPVFTAVPTVLAIPNQENQIGLPATPLTSVVLPPSNDIKSSLEHKETSTSTYDTQKSSRTSSIYRKQKHRSSGYVHGPLSKRPTFYVNSVYGYPVKMKPIASIPHQQQKFTSVSIQPSIDLSAQYSHKVASSSYPSSANPTLGYGITYGPAKALDLQHKLRSSASSVYHKIKGTSHRHYYSPEKMRVYSHPHRDHVHNHYFPLKTYKSQASTKYAAPTYLPPVSTTPSALVNNKPLHEIPSSYPYQKLLTFPEKDVATPSQELHQTNNSPGDVTKAIIKSQGVINNYDASIPIHVPSKKPYQFEVKEILKNSDLHFVQENNNNANNFVAGQNNALFQYTPKLPYQNPLIFNQPFYSTLDKSNIVPAPLEMFNLPGANAYHTNQIIQDQDLGTSESIKVPVAIIRGPQFAINNQPALGFTMKRQDQTIESETKKPFTPSRRTSDWVPMSGNGVPIVEEVSENADKLLLTSPGSEHVPLPGSQTNKETKAQSVRHQVGDIISGKIPEEFAPKNFISKYENDAKIPYTINLSGEGSQRKGSVIDVYPPSASKISNVGDTSDLVVSSVIKFS